MLSVFFIAGCSTQEPVWRLKALQSIQQLEKEDAPELLPEAYFSMRQTFDNGDQIFRLEEDGEQADLQYQLAFQKSCLLKDELLAYKACKEAEAREIADEEEQLRLEEERKKQEAALKEEYLKKEALAKRKLKNGSAENGANGGRERNQTPTYIVKRGETLPQIAARPEVYNDSSLWQLIYKANRDQVRDPYQLWPGQVLKIPRAYSRDEAADARKLVHRR